MFSLNDFGNIYRDGKAIVNTGNYCQHKSGCNYVPLWLQQDLSRVVGTTQLHLFYSCCVYTHKYTYLSVSIARAALGG